MNRSKIIIYTAGALFAGIAGVLQFARLSVGDPTVADGLELDVIAAVIIGGGSLSGGRGTVFGTLLGATTMAVIQIGCAQKGYPNWVQQIVTGAIIVLAVALDRWRQGKPMRCWPVGTGLPMTQIPQTEVPCQGECQEVQGVVDQSLRIIDLEVLDLRFPTARAAIGTDAMHPDPDYSAAYVILKTDGDLEGHGFTFTIGRGNEVCVAAIEAFRHLVVGRTLEDLTADLGAFWRELAGDSQLRWLGPEKGVIHISMAAIVNAVWDLYAKAERKPVWKLLADMTPAEIVRCIDFRYITDALTPDEAIDLLERQRSTKADRERTLLQSGYPAYTTSAGWIGYSDDRIRRGLPRRHRRRAGRTSRSRSARAPKTTTSVSASCARPSVPIAR